MLNAGTMSSVVADRVRDPNFNATTQPQTIQLLSYSQQVVNGILGDNVGTTPLVVQPRSLIYQISSFLPQVVKIQAIRDAGGRDLEPMVFESLSWLNMKWITSTADAPRGYALAGRDILVIYPGIRYPQTLTVVYSTLTPTLATTADSTVLPNEDDDATLDLAEALLLIQHRDMAGVKTVFDRFNARIKELRNERR
jgi:hypothetical protein